MEWQPVWFTFSLGVNILADSVIYTVHSLLNLKLIEADELAASVLYGSNTTALSLPYLRVTN
jgi:hypothetical protein